MTKEASYTNLKKPIPQEHSGATLINTPHLFLMILPNVFNPRKLVNNLMHPFREMLHTSHIQYPTPNDPETYIVEHKLLGKLVTVDIVKRDRFPKPWILRLKQLFDRNFYYGHAQYFPEPFKLIARTYIEDPASFNPDDHTNTILSNLSK